MVLKGPELLRIKYTACTRGCLARSCRARERPCHSTLPYLAEEAHSTVCAEDLVRGSPGGGSVDAERRPRRVREPACASPLCSQPLKRLCYRRLPVAEHPHQYIPHPVQTHEESVGCGRPDLAPLRLCGIELRGVRQMAHHLDGAVCTLQAPISWRPCEGHCVARYGPHLFAAPAGKP